MSTKQKKSANDMVIPFEDYLEQYDLTLPDFAKLFGLPENTVRTMMNEHPHLSMIGSRLYTRTSYYQAKFEHSAKTAGIPLKKYLRDKHKNNPNSLAKELGESSTFVYAAVADDAYWVDGEIFQMLPEKSSWVAIPLVDHIQNVCDGNTAAFSRAYDITQQQMDRWVKRDCLFCRGEIYLRRTELVGEPAKDTNATLLRDHLREKYGSIEDGIGLFADEHQLNPQQVRRYIGYDALWILGDVYKNQSKFAEKNIVPDFGRAFKKRKTHVRRSQTAAEPA